MQAERTNLEAAHEDQDHDVTVEDSQDVDDDMNPSITGGHCRDAHLAIHAHLRLSACAAFLIGFFIWDEGALCDQAIKYGAPIDNAGATEGSRSGRKQQMGPYGEDSDRFDTENELEDGFSFVTDDADGFDSDAVRNIILLSTATYPAYLCIPYTRTKLSSRNAFKALMKSYPWKGPRICSRSV